MGFEKASVQSLQRNTNPKGFAYLVAPYCSDAHGAAPLCPLRWGGGGWDPWQPPLLVVVPGCQPISFNQGKQELRWQLTACWRLTSLSRLNSIPFVKDFKWQVGQVLNFNQLFIFKILILFLCSYLFSQHA